MALVPTEIYLNFKSDRTTTQFNVHIWSISEQSVPISGTTIWGVMSKAIFCILWSDFYKLLSNTIWIYVWVTKHGPIYSNISDKHDISLGKPTYVYIHKNSCSDTIYFEIIFTIWARTSQLGVGCTLTFQGVHGNDGILLNN